MELPPDTNMQWYVDSQLVSRLRKRAEIRRSIPRGEPDRISDLLEEAAKEIERLQKGYTELKDEIYNSRHGNYGSH